MITAEKLFRQRLISGWKYQYSVWKTVVDWIVAIYILIPFSAIFIDSYIGWWKQIPTVLDSFPLNALLGIVLLFSWSGTLRIYVEDADQIFLFQRKAWIKRLSWYSIAYFIGFNFIVILLLCFILAPFLLFHYGFTLSSFLRFILFTFILKSSIGILKQLIQLRFKGWKQNLVKVVFLALSGFYLQFGVFTLLKRFTIFLVSFLLLLIILGLLIYQRATISGTLLEDISMGQDAKLKFTNVLLKYAGTYMKKNITFRKRPWLFRNSNLMFCERTPENGLVELCLKSTLRHGANFKFYLQVVVTYVLFISAFPPNLKWILWGASIVIFIALVKMFWLEVVNSPYVLLFPLPAETKLRAASRSLFLLALPGQIILLLFVVLETHEWFHALMLLPLGILLSKFTSKKLAMYS